jgi:Na+/H+ antiporter NhaD/arsenite permease-like protein
MAARVLHGDGSSYDVYTGAAYDIVAVCIFLVVSITFFFPVNRIFPLDRRSVAVVGATLCYLSGAFLFPQHQRELENSVDFDVLVLLSGIMAINFIVVHQSETKALILSVQNKINENPKKGFWVVSFAAFITSPFLTNDGICLLFVEPILNAFSSIGSSSVADSQSPDAPLVLQKPDAFYFLITLACSSNIGSALTYTGNPQVLS